MCQIIPIGRILIENGREPLENFGNNYQFSSRDFYTVITSNKIQCYNLYQIDAAKNIIQFILL